MGVFCFAGINVDVSYTTLQRDCTEVPKENTAAYAAALYSDGCHSGSNAAGSNPAQALIQESHKGVDVNDATLNGEVCFDGNSVSTGGGATVRAITSLWTVLSVIAVSLARLL